MVNIIHFREKCIGCNSCVEHAPSFWAISLKDGKSTLKKSTKKGSIFIKEVDFSSLQELEKAEKDCPVHIIRILR